MRTRLAIIAAGAVLLAPALAAAQEESGCPPGAWFCEETPPPSEDADETLEQPEPEGTAEEGGRARRRPPPVAHEPVVVDRPEDSPPPPKRKRWKRKWGLNLHLQAAMMGSHKQRHEDSGMGGLGFSLRYRPIPHFAFDTGLDFVGGVDWQGNNRRETALLLNAMVFFNPKNPVQVYMLGGIGFSGATVTSRDDAGEPIADTERNYSYFGGQLGAGLEFRVSHSVSLNLDVIGFVRGRTDERARLEPEFTDPDTGRTTNSSGGGLVRGGITFYW